MELALLSFVCLACRGAYVSLEAIKTECYDLQLISVIAREKVGEMIHCSVWRKRIGDRALWTAIA